MTLHDWLHECRIQGSGGFMAAFTTAAYISGMRGWLLLLPITSAFFYHCFGFAHNQWEDRERDLQDHSRPPGAFSAGRIPALQAKVGITILLVLSTVPIIWASYLRGDVGWLAWWGLSVFFAFAYNRFGKVGSRWRGLVFYIGGTALPAVTWGLVQAGGLTPVMVLFAVLLVPASAVGLFAGDYKDIDVYEKSGEGNLWRALGVRAKPGWNKKRAITRANMITAVALLLVPVAFIPELGWAMWVLVSVLPFVVFFAARPLHYWKV